MRIIVLAGGLSPERDVSLISDVYKRQEYISKRSGIYSMNLKRKIPASILAVH